MTRTITLIISYLIATGIVQGAHQNSRTPQSRRLLPRAKPIDELCNDPSLGLDSSFFGDFTTGGGLYSKMPLNIQGNMKAPGYTVNTAHKVNCSNPNSLPAYGLIVGGLLQQSPNVTVYGSALVAGGGDLNEIEEKNPDCVVSSTLGTGEINFEVLHYLRSSDNKIFARNKPTLVINEDNSYTRVRDPIDGAYEVFQFNTCQQQSCGDMYPGQMSSAKDILQNPRYFDGIKGFVANPDVIYLFNMPVRDGESLQINNYKPAKEMDPCRVIFNPYPVNSTNGYAENGSITYIRDTNDLMGGYTLAPHADIVDMSSGGFAGEVVGKSYRWGSPQYGVGIYDYREAGGNCDVFNPCSRDVVITGSATQDATYSTLSGTLTGQTPSNSGGRGIESRTDSTLSGTLTNQTPSKNSEFSTVTDIPSSSTQEFSTVTGDPDPTDQGFLTVTGDPVNDTSGGNPETCIPSLTIAGKAKTKTITGNAKTVTVDLSDGPSTFTLTHKIVTITPSTATTDYTELTTVIITDTLSKDSTVTVEITKS